MIVVTGSRLSRGACFRLSRALLTKPHKPHSGKKSGALPESRFYTPCGVSGKRRLASFSARPSSDRSGARSGGYDVINGLRGGRSLAASFTMIDRRADRQGNLDSVTSAVVVGLALLRPGRAVYSGTRAWLADEMPRDAAAARLQSLRLRVDTRPTAVPGAPPARRARPAHAMTWDQTKAAAQRLDLL
jgi:hypothetical protein